MASEPSAINLKTGQPIKIRLSKVRRRNVAADALDDAFDAWSAGRNHGEAGGSRATREARGPKGQAGPTLQKDGGARRRGGPEITVPAPLALAKKLTRSPKRQAGIVLGYMIADAVLGALRGQR